MGDVHVVYGGEMKNVSGAVAEKFREQESTGVLISLMALPGCYALKHGHGSDK